MAISPALPASRFAAVIVAAGKGLRAGQPLPKQFALWRGKPVLRQAAEALRKAGAGPIAIAIPQGAQQLAEQILDGLPNVRLVVGGASRQESVALALEELSADQPSYVLIHDAARPDCPRAVVDRLLGALATHAGAIPVLPVVDSMIVARDGVMGANARREDLRRVQTPQAFRYGAILAAHRIWEGETPAGDDAQVLRAASQDVASPDVASPDVASQYVESQYVALVDGDARLHKLTFAEDFLDQPDQNPEPVSDKTNGPAIRTGMGFDVHRLVAGEELWLCGIKLDHDKGLSGHSDADVALHALVDAVLGAVAQGDIGDHFPPSDPQWRGAPSSRFVEHAVKLAAQSGYGIGNVDLTIICEAPKIGPHRDTMRKYLAQLLAVDPQFVSVKATTSERLGFTGRGEGIAAQAIATLVRT